MKTLIVPLLGLLTFSPLGWSTDCQVFSRDQAVINLHTEKLPYKHTYYMKATGEDGKVKVFRVLTDQRWPRSDDELVELVRTGSTASGKPGIRVQGNGEWKTNTNSLDPSKLKNIELLVGPASKGDVTFDKNLNDKALCDMATGKARGGGSGGGDSGQGST